LLSNVGALPISSYVFSCFDLSQSNLFSLLDTPGYFARHPRELASLVGVGSAASSGKREFKVRDVKFLRDLLTIGSILLESYSQMRDSNRMFPASSR
jgi:hypothetical protein